MSYYRTFPTSQCSDLVQARLFLRNHGVALAKAVRKLGGPTASARVFLLCEAVRHTRFLTRTQRRQLVEFYKMLTLSHAANPDRIEAGLFVMIDPASAFVEERRLLSENLGGLLRSIAGNDPINEAFCDASNKFFKVA